MAIERTKGRKNYVRPLGLVDSGGQAMAKATQHIAESIYNITGTIDEAELKTAYIEAEKQGKLLGTKEDKDGNIIPLTQTALNSFQPNMFNKANQRLAQERFKTYAIASFGMAIQNDAVDSAEKSLLKHGGTMGGNGQLSVFNDSSEYIKSLKSKVSSDVWAEVGSTIEKQWGFRVRKASALHLEEVRAKNLFNAEKNLQTILADETSIRTSGGDAETINAELEDTQIRKDKAFAIIKDNVKSEVEFEKIKMAYTTSLQSNVSIASIDAAYLAKVPFSEMKVMAQEQVNRWKNDPNVDGEAIKKSMEAKIQYYEQVDRLEKSEKIEVSASRLYKELNKLPFIKNSGDLLTPNGIANLNLEPPHEYTLTNVINGYASTLKAAESSAWQQSAEPHIFNLENESIGNFTKQNSLKWLQENFHKLNGTNRDKVREAHAKWLDSRIKTNSQLAFGEFINEMENSKTFTIHPMQFRLSMKKLVSQNVIGDKPTSIMTIREFQNKLSSYTNKWNDFQNDLQSAKSIKSRTDTGQSLRPKDIVLYKKLGLIPSKVHFKQDNGSVQTFNLDIFSDNEAVSNRSIEIAVAWSIENNTLYPGLEESLNNFVTMSPYGFEKAQQFYRMLIGSAQNHQKDTDYVHHTILKKVNTMRLSAAQFYDQEALKQSYKIDDKSTARIESLVVGEGETLVDIFDRKWETIEDYTWSVTGMFKAIIPNEIKLLTQSANDWTGLISDEQKKTYKDFLAKVGYNDFNDVIKNTPRLKSLLVDSFRVNLHSNLIDWSKGKEAAINEAMKMSISAVMEHIGVHIDGNGEAKLMLNPPKLEFQRTVPSGTDEIVKITDQDVNEYIYNTVKSIAGIMDTQTYQAIENKQFIIESHESWGSNPTYKIFVDRGDGSRRLIHENLTFDFKYSKQSKAYKMAENQLKNDKIGQTLWEYLPGIDQMALRGLYHRWNDGMSTENFVRSLVNVYNNSVMAIIPLDANPEEHLIDADMYDMAKARSLILSLGLDANAHAMNPGSHKSVLDVN